MISFDLAPNLELPLLKNTPGSFYFNKRRTSALFGFNLEAPNFQYNFLIDEFDVKNLTAAIWYFEAYYNYYNDFLNKEETLWSTN